ncbi:MAG: uracil-xanthine permease [Oscillospiraceae bacterium]|nr:uracil-xanthine permease [Oscillospiraceae bacterium]MBR6208387.1 uracil-xanthine permease [Oscillospiraceae bacterium]
MSKEENAIYNAKELGTGKVVVLGLQHLFAMFGSTVLVPILTGLSVSATLLFAGLATLFMHLVTGKKVPVFLGSSFAFLGGYFSVVAAGGELGMTQREALPYACVGVACAGLLYLILSAICKAFGSKRVMRFFPPVVTGPIIIAIGLILAPSAINSCSTNWLIALVAIVVIVVCNIWGKGMIKIVPILMGVLVSYLVAALAGKVDFSGVKEAAWIGLPVQMQDTVFGLFGSGDVNKGLLVSSIIMIVPIAFATMMEHVGDISAIGSTIGKNLIEDPGLHRTLIGDGIGTAIAALFGAPANTTYGENTGVLVLTKVYDPMVVRLAAVFAVVLSFCPKFAALISAMPTATVGGVSIVLYGMISAVGVRNMVENHTDFQKSRNVIVAAVILGLALGINFSGSLGANITTAGNNATGAISFMVGDMKIALSGLAVASIVGIVLNAILPDKREEYMPNTQNSGSLGKF